MSQVVMYPGIITSIALCVTNVYRAESSLNLRLTETDQHFVNTKGLTTGGRKLSVTASFQTN